MLISAISQITLASDRVTAKDWQINKLPSIAGQDSVTHPTIWDLTFIATP